MSRYEHGRVLAVNETTLGSELVGDHAQGVGSLTVEDPVDFDEDGGWLKIADQVVEYTTYDDDTGVITLAGTLDAAAGEGDRVDLWDELRQVVTVDKIAQVELDGDDDNTDPLEAVIPLHLLDDLAEGIRGIRGESVLLEQDGDEWRIVDALGLAASGASGAMWEADDVYVLTAADITAGTATCPLSHRPVDESVDARWGVLPQEPTEYTVNYDAQTVTWPLDGFEQAGDRLWFHYTYRAGISNQPPVIEFGSDGWLYKTLASTDATDYSLPTVDDSTWSTGSAAFGSPGGLGYDQYGGFKTTWAADSRIWLRRHLDGPLSAVSIFVRVDNDADVYWDGVLLGSHSWASDTEFTSPPEFPVPAELLVGASHVLAVRATDDTGTADRALIDVKVVMTR